MIESSSENEKDTIQMGPLKELLKFFDFNLNLTPHETYKSILQKRNTLKNSKNQEKNFICVETIIFLYFSENDSSQYLDYSYLPQEERRELIAFHQELGTRMITLLKNETLQDENIDLFEDEIGTIFFDFGNLYPFFSKVQFLVQFKGYSLSEYLRTILLCIQNQYSLSMKYLIDNGIEKTELVCPLASFDDVFNLKKILDYFIDVVRGLENKTKTIDSFFKDILFLTEEIFKKVQTKNFDCYYTILTVSRGIKLLQSYCSKKEESCIQKDQKNESPNILVKKEEIFPSNSKNICSQKEELSPLLLNQGISTESIKYENEPQKEDEKKEKIIIDEKSNVRDNIEKEVGENEDMQKEISLMEKEMKKKMSLMEKKMKLMEKEMNLIKEQLKKILEKNEEQSKENKKLKKDVKEANHLNQIRLKNLWTSQNENQKDKKIIDNLKLDLAKRGYLKILIEFCSALNNLKNNFKKYIFGDEIIEDYKTLFENIKFELNAKAHIPK